MSENDPDIRCEVAIIPRSGLGCDLPGGRHVACVRLDDGGYLWRWSRPSGDATVMTELRLSDDAHAAMVSIGLKMLDTTEISLAT